MRRWVERAGIRLRAVRMFGPACTGVAEQRATWRSGPGREHTIATVFVLHGELVCRIVRHDNLADALASAGLTELDAIPTRDENNDGDESTER